MAQAGANKACALSPLHLANAKNSACMESVCITLVSNHGAKEGARRRASLLLLCSVLLAGGACKIASSAASSDSDPDEQDSIDPQVCSVPVVDVVPPRCDFGAIPIGEAAYCSVQLFSDCATTVIEVAVTDDALVGDAFGAAQGFPIPAPFPQSSGVELILYATPRDEFAIDEALILQFADPDHEPVAIPVSFRGTLSP